jgi:hypothetical protein
LNEVQGMDVTSFAYQTSIQQITQQEQGEADHLMETLAGGWKLHGGYWYVWDWIGFLIGLGLIFFGCLSFAIATVES